jgi:CelD/BcsL family acetyltransferase involved in cellulose biosynthesis
LALERACTRNFEELFQALLALHTRRWQQRGQTGVLHEEALRRFHWQVASTMLAQGHLRLFGLRLNSKIEAVLYAFADRFRTYFYLSGFNPHLAAYSPGSLLIAHALAEALQEHSPEFDFLRGAEPYKYRWGAINRETHRISGTLQIGFERENVWRGV